jgi:hypothetical protein
MFGPDLKMECPQCCFFFFIIIIIIIIIIIVVFCFLRLVKGIP